MRLGKLFNKYGTDKTEKHRYDIIYEKFFEPIKNDKLNILEIGVDMGQSTMAFHDYFCNSTIYGIDLFERQSKEDILPYKINHGTYLNRCNFIKANSCLPFKDKLPDIKFDIIIDDGKHTPKANMLTFQHSINMLADNGQYFIEDVWPIEDMTIIELQHQWIKTKPHAFTKYVNDQFLKVLEDSKMKIERFDHRKYSGQPDSYIIRLTK